MMTAVTAPAIILAFCFVVLGRMAPDASAC
ncbi:hypothetical protein SAMN05192541_103567 [Bradyrhizobium arachidis]|nr:hypothetical protein SAMN05192541_103567 [Bradyrhizobium arachidis]